MYVEVEQAAQGEPLVQLREPDDCTRLHIVSLGLTDEEVLQLLAARGAALPHQQPGHVRLRVEWLRSSAQASGVGEDWGTRFQQMLRYSEEKAWLEPDTQTLTAHIARDGGRISQEQSTTQRPRSVAIDAEPVQSAGKIDPNWFRKVLGQYPTGVCAVTSASTEDSPVGMTVGSFTSVSLDPPLVAFFPDKGSTSWPKIQASGRFCVNILSDEQESVCRQIASRNPHKMNAIAHRFSPNGNPVIDSVVAWIDCEIASVYEAGDHFIVLGLVLHLQIENPSLPLLFFRGGYGRFQPLSLASPDPTGGLAEQLRRVDLIRPLMESLATRFSCMCIATARTGDEVVIVASAGTGKSGRQDTTLVGTRLPLVLPAAAILTAWDPDDELNAWLQRTTRPENHDRIKRTLETVRRRGYSFTMKSPAQHAFARAIAEMTNAAPGSDDKVTALAQDLVFDPPELADTDAAGLGQISVPVFASDGTVALALTFYGFAGGSPSVVRTAPQLAAAGNEASRLVASWPPRRDPGRTTRRCTGRSQQQS